MGAAEARTLTLGTHRTGRAGREQAGRLALTLGLVVVFLAASFATSDTARALDVTIQNPLHGGEYQAPYDGPLTVDFTGAPPDTYSLSVTGSGYIWEAEHVFDGQNQSFSQPFSEILDPGTYEASVEDSSGVEIASAAFSVRGVDDATIEAPNHGQTLLAPFSGNVSVHWSSIGSPTDDYLVEVVGGSTQNSCDYLGEDIRGMTTHCPVSIGAGEYDVFVSNPQGDVLDHVAFSVAPRLRLTDVRVGPRSFFPLVRDGFRDSTTIRFRTNKPSRNRVHVANGRRTIKRVELGGHSGGGLHRWTWNGRDSAGRKVEPGRYQLQVIASAQGETKRAPKAVTVRTRVLRRNFSQSKRGTAFRSRGKRGNCNFDRFDGEALLTCLFGVAWTDYSFKMSPGSLRHIERGPVVTGVSFRYRNGLVRCHAATDAARRGRTLITRFLSNGQNGWSQCWVVSAKIKYSYFYRQ